MINFNKYLCQEDIDSIKLSIKEHINHKLMFVNDFSMFLDGMDYLLVQHDEDDRIILLSVCDMYDNIIEQFDNIDKCIDYLIENYDFACYQYL